MSTRVTLLLLSNSSQTYSICALFGDLVSFCIHVQTAMDGINKTAGNGNIKMSFYTICCVCTVYSCACYNIIVFLRVSEYSSYIKQFLCSPLLFAWTLCWPSIASFFTPNSSYSGFKTDYLTLQILTTFMMSRRSDTTVIFVAQQLHFSASWQSYVQSFKLETVLTSWEE